jgi:hypothetical protein
MIPAGPDKKDKVENKKKPRRKDASKKAKKS